MVSCGFSRLMMFVHERLEQSRAVRIGMLRQHSLARGLANFPGALYVQVTQVVDDLLTAVSQQDFVARLQKCFCTFPAISDDTGTGTGGFENPRGRREADSRHA